MFEKASRLKLRFETSKGLVTVEDLWDLPLSSSTGKANLDDVARSLHNQLKNEEDISFVKPETKDNMPMKLGFEIVKHIISVKLSEKSAREQVEANREKKQKIMSIIEQKQDTALSAMSIEELSAMVASL